MYLTDNSGEIYFDQPLYDMISQRADRVILTVKGGPGLNDLTRADLERAGLTGRFGRIADTGVAGAGIDWGRAPREFEETR